MVPSLAFALLSLTFLSFTIMLLSLALTFWVLSSRFWAFHSSNLLQMSCLVSFWEKPLCSHIFEPYPPSLNFHGSEPCFHVSKPCSHVFGPHFVGSLDFFDLDHTAVDLCLRNICPVTLTLGCVLRRASWRTYKDNVSDMKLGCKNIKRRYLGRDNMDWASWIR